MDGGNLVDLRFWRHAQELRNTWQGRVLARCLVLGTSGAVKPRDVTGAALLSVIAHNYDDGMDTLLRVLFDGYTGVGNPALCSAAKINKAGQVCADIVDRDGNKKILECLFESKTAMESDFRRVADRARLSDAERVEMFDAIKRWIVCDYRIDPTMDPNDPDAKRLVH